MSNATEQARSSRGDARAFADAFSAADDAFTDGLRAGESRTVTLAELEAVLELDAPVDLAAERPAPPAPAKLADARAAADAGLLTLAELGEVLAAPPAPADDVDFDFGTRTAERARRRTAARSGSSTPVRRTSGPASPERLGGSPSSTTTAGPSVPRGGAPAGAPRPAVATPLVAPAPRRALQPAPMAPAAARRPRPGSAAVQRFRAEPDRIALYAVLLGILLVLIAASSSSASAASALVLQLR